MLSNVKNRLISTYGLRDGQQGFHPLSGFLPIANCLLPISNALSEAKGSS